MSSYQEGNQSNIPCDLPQSFSQHHTFDVNLACKYGVHAALIIHHFIYWISFNKRMKRNFRDGRYWTYQTQEEISATLPYLNRKQVMRLLDFLQEQGIIIKGNYNKNSMDQTTWYAFKDQSFLNNYYDCPKIDNAESENGQCLSKNGQCIGTDTIPTDSLPKDTTTTTQPKEEAVAVAVFSDEQLKGLPITSSEQVSLSAQFGNQQLKHMVEYHKAKMEINPDFVPKIGWLNYFADVCRKQYPIPQKPQKQDNEAKKLVDIENNRYIAQCIYDEFEKQMTEYELLNINKDRIAYTLRQGKATTFRDIYFHSTSFENEINDLKILLTKRN